MAWWQDRTFPVTTATAAQRAAQHMLGTNLRRWVQAQRDTGASWQTVAHALRDATDGVIDLHRETLRTWFGDIPRKGRRP
jgi:hypothetical protein